MRLPALRRPSPLSLFLYLAGFACLAITALMNRHAGVSQGATEEGRQLLGAGAIAIDIVGLVIFGSAAGNLFAAGKKFLGGAVLVVVIGCAVFSISSIMSFVASEWLSVAESRRAAEQLGKERRAAVEAAAKERRALQAELAKQHLKVLEGTSIGKGGRQERRDLRKDMNAAATELIAKVGQGEAATPEAPAPEVALRPDGGAEVMSWITNAPERTVQITRMAGLAVLLIVLKAFAFPLGGYYWKKKADEVLVLMGSGPHPEPVHLKSQPNLALPAPNLGAGGQTGPVKALTAPIFPARPEPSLEARQLLDAIRLPRTQLDGELRPQDAREHVAIRFLAYLTTYELSGDYSPEALDRLYAEFCAVDHRQPAPKIVKGELRAFKRHAWSVPPTKRRDTLWTIRCPATVKMLAMLARAGLEAEPKPDKGRVLSLFPLAPSAADQPEGAAADTAPAAPASRPHNASDVGQSSPKPRERLKSEAPVKGLAQLHRYMPDWEQSLRKLARMDKLAWQAKTITPNRKSLNRFSRARSAA